jgi:hypothetical protein
LRPWKSGAPGGEVEDLLVVVVHVSSMPGGSDIPSCGFDYKDPTA